MSFTEIKRQYSDLESNIAILVNIKNEKSQKITLSKLFFYSLVDNLR